MVSRSTVPIHFQTLNCSEWEAKNKQDKWWHSAVKDTEKHCTCKNEFFALPTRSYHKLVEGKQREDWPTDPHNLWHNPSYSSMAECPPSDRREAGNWEQISYKVKEEPFRLLRSLDHKNSLHYLCFCMEKGAHTFSSLSSLHYFTSFLSVHYLNARHTRLFRSAELQAELHGQ